MIHLERHIQVIGKRDIVCSTFILALILVQLHRRVSFTFERRSNLSFFNEDSEILWYQLMILCWVCRETIEYTWIPLGVQYNKEINKTKTVTLHIIECNHLLYPGFSTSWGRVCYYYSQFIIRIHMTPCFLQC